MKVVEVWTGRHANALRMALRMTNEEFAHHLGVAVRTVAKWNADPDLVPVAELQRALDTALSQATQDAKDRFGLLTGATVGVAARPVRPHALDEAVELRLGRDPAIRDALHWLDRQAGWPEGEARRRLREWLSTFDLESLNDQVYRRGEVERGDLAQALAMYYGDAKSPHHFYRVRCGSEIGTSILTRSEWLNARVPLGDGQERLSYSGTTAQQRHRLDEVAARAVLSRLAEILSLDTRLVNAPLYSLLRIDVTPQRLTGLLGLTDFVDYALTLDLLETEMVDAVSSGRPVTVGALPLRDRYLPHTAALVDIGLRLCAGGPLALMAIARPGRRRGREPDYALLVQERSGKVLNAARRLAVVPKAFHQPMVDLSEDTDISSTLEREMEEELFGRPELDSTRGQQRRADPMHADQLSDPMRWLLDRARPYSWRMECVGFGINTASGNYEFACLIVIEDEQWWREFGGAIEGNWETEGLHRYSSLDRELLTGLVHDPAWSNEGLFAFLQSLRRLSEIGGSRVDLPAIEVEGP